MKRRIPALFLALVLIVTAFAFTSCDETELGADAFVKTKSEFTEMYKSMYEGFGALYTENSEKNVATGVELTMKSVSNEQFNKLLPATLKGNAVYNVSEKKVALSASAAVAEKEFATNLYAYDGAVYFDLGIGKYVKIDSDKEDINTDLNGEADTIAEGLQALKDLLSEKITSDDFINEKIEITVDGEKIEATKITLELDEERLAEIAEGYKAYCEERKEQLQKIYAFLKSLTEEEDAEIPETKEELEAWLTELVEKIKAADIELDWDYIISDGELIEEKVTVNNEGKRLVCTADYDSDENGSSGAIVMTVVDAEGNERVITSITYTMVNEETKSTYKTVFEVPGKEKTFKTEITAVVTENEPIDLCIKWILDENVFAELDGKLVYTNTDTVKYLDFDGSLKIAEQEFTFQIKLNYDATGEKELVIPEFTDENTIDYASYAKTFVPDYAKDIEKTETESTIGNGKIDIEFPGFPNKKDEG